MARPGQEVAPAAVEVAHPAPQRRLPRAPENGLAKSLERRRLQAYLAQVVADSAILLGSFAAVSTAYLARSGSMLAIMNAMQPGYLILPLLLTIAMYNGTYSRDGLTNWRRATSKALTALAISAILVNLLAFFAKMNAEFSRVIFTGAIVLSGLLFAAYRAIFARWLESHWGPNASNRLVILAGGPKFTLPHAYHIDAIEHGLVPDSEDPAALDRLAKYLRNMDHVLISSTGEDRQAWADILKGTGVQGEIVDQTSREVGALGVIHHDEANIATLLVSTGHLGIRARATKRVFDIALSGTALLLLGIPMLLVALVIKLQDGGPVFFMQRRMGRGNEFFDIYKFRSMREGDADGSRSASRDDNRVTSFGRFIRRTSIDELPQLINVLKGDMSIVGPRPHALGSKAGTKLFWEIDRKYWHRHGLRPGITGLAQIRGYRGATDRESDLTNRLVADLEYIGTWSLWRDIKIIFATITVLVHDRAF